MNAKQALHVLGDVSTADIQLHLLSSTGEDYPGNPLHLHSQLLQKSKFLEAMLSARWSCDERPLKIEVTTTVEGFENYVKCFEFMYSSASEDVVAFSSVEECLTILQVCAHLLIDECLNECMKYLGAVPWSPLQESKIRAVLISLQLQTLPDLAARLDNRHLNYLEELEASTTAMLRLLCQTEEGFPTSFKADNTECEIRKYLESKLKGNASADVSDMYMRVLFEEYYKINLEIIKRMGSGCDHACYAVVWFLQLIERTDQNMYDKAIKMFCEDSKLPDAIRFLLGRSKEYMKVFMKILVSFVKDLGSGKIISSRAYRLSYLTSWLNVMIMICVYDFDDDEHAKLKEMEEGVMRLLETLPFIDQKSVYEAWIPEYKRHGIERSRIFRWWFEKLEHAHHNSKIED